MWWERLLAAAKKLQHVVVPESTVAALADAEERQLAAIAETLDGVDVQVKHLRYFGRGEQLPDLVRHHR